MSSEYRVKRARSGRSRERTFLRVNSLTVNSIVLATVVTLAGGGTVLSQENTAADEQQILQAVLATWNEHDASAAFRQLESDGSPEAVANQYIKLAQHVYNVHKDVPKMILTARAGIHYTLDQARRNEATNPEAARTLRRAAKTIAYNLGANCWPGWKDEGITINPTDLAIGMDAARLNLRLAVELERPAEPMANAHWLLGAHLLAARQYDAAIAEFTKTAEKFGEADKADARLMGLGYAALAGKLKQPGDAAAAESLKSAIQSLLDLGTGDAKFYAEQLRTAEDVFTN
jgi:hypothetical protein